VHADVRLNGTPLAPGVAVGRACLYQRRDYDPGPEQENDRGQEASRLHRALLRLDNHLEMLARNTAEKLGNESAEIFQAHRLLLADESFRSRLAQAVKVRGLTASRAVKRELDFYRIQLSTAGSEYLRERAGDIKEIQQALLDCLNHAVPYRRCREVSRCSVEHCRLGNDHILVGDELYASLPIETDSHTVGFIVEKGGPNSHAIILARAQHRPAVGNIHNPATVIPLDTQILINGDTGEVILNPSTSTLAQHQHAPSGSAETMHVVDPVAGLRVMANIERFTDVHEALVTGAEGIGLYRTEIELLVAGRMLSEAEQAERYSEIVRVMAGRPVCIRLLDFGADKAAPFLGHAMEENGMAALRGARLLLAHPELLRDQARALVRASRHGPIHVLYPMIVDVEQFHALRTLFDRLVSGLQPSRLQHGVLFEVPSACLQARQILEAADFGCIGTNDLIQYLFAENRASGVDPGNPSYENAPVLWSLIEDLSRAGRETGKPMAICGELAGNPELTRRIIQAGITTVSTAPSRIAGVRLESRRLLSRRTTRSHAGH